MFFARNEKGISKVNVIGDWLINKQKSYANDDSFFSRFVIAPLLWQFKKLMNLTETVDDTFKQDGIRTLAYGYYGIVLDYLVTIFVLAVVVIVVAGFVASFIIGSMLGGGASDTRETDSKTRGFLARDGESRKRKGWFDDEYIEHKKK